MRANSRFAVPVEQRIAEAKADTLKKHAENAVCEQPGCPLAEDAGKQKTTTKPRAKTKPRNQRPKSMKPRNQKA